MSVFLIFEKEAVRSNQIQDLVCGGNKVTELHQQLLSVVFLQMRFFFEQCGTNFLGVGYGILKFLAPIFLPEVCKCFDEILPEPIQHLVIAGRAPFFAFLALRFIIRIHWGNQCQNWIVLRCVQLLV